MATLSLKCPNCGGEIVYNPSGSNYTCPYCSSEFTSDVLEPQIEKSSYKKPPLMYNCPSCGAEIIRDDTTAATRCYYCHNPVILTGRLEGKYLPDLVIPFAIDKNAAIQQFLKLVKKKKYIPAAFFNSKQLENFSGVYFPYWVYNAKLDGSINASATTLRSWRAGNKMYTERKRYQVDRKGQVDIHNLTKNALQKNNRELIEGILPYQLTTAETFNPGYLSGFGAEKRDIEKETLAPEVQENIVEYATNLLKETITGYNSVSVESKDFRLLEEKWSYILLPVWTLTYKGKNDKLYFYSMNGQNGKIFGAFPVDKKKLSFVSLIVGVVVFIIGLIGGFLI